MLGRSVRDIESSTVIGALIAVGELGVSAGYDADARDAAERDLVAELTDVFGL